MTYWQTVDPPMSFVPEAWTYAQKRSFRYRVIPYLREAAGFSRMAGKRVLCIGDGSGIDAAEFARHGARVSVIDLSAKAIELTGSHFLEAGLDLDDWHVGSATSLPFAAASFDHVYSFGVIHHIENVERVVSEVARVLRPGGTFSGMVYHADSLLYAYSIVLRGVRAGMTPDEAMRQWSERNPGCPYSKAYTREELHGLLVAQFASTEIGVYYPVIDLPTKRKVPFEMQGGDQLGWHLFFWAFKSAARHSEEP